jgi:hypothetical protein
VEQDYLKVASGDLADTADRFRTEQAQVGAAESALAADLRATDRAAYLAQTARSQALSLAASTQTQLVSVQARLQTLTAGQGGGGTQGLPVNSGLVDVVKTVTSPSTTPVPTTSPTTTPPPQPTSSGRSGGSYTPAGGPWLELRECESSDNYAENTGNGYYGAYQFSWQTWSSLGYPGRPDQEPPAMQDAAAQKLQARSGWGQWPACSAALGLR